MSRRRRGRLGPPITLFSFQDIIASVTGMIIFVTFMLLLELVIRPASAAPSPAADSAAARADDAERRLSELRLRSPGTPVSEAEIAAAREATAALADLARVLAERAAEVAPKIEEAEAGLHERRGELEAARLELEEAQRQLQRERATTRVTLLRGPRDGKETRFIECAADELRMGTIDPDSGVTRFERAFATAGDALAWCLARPDDAERFVLVVRPEGVEAYGQLQQGLRAHGRDVGWDLWAADKPLFPRETEAADAAAE